MLQPVEGEWSLLAAVRGGTPHKMDLRGSGAQLLFSGASPVKCGCAGHIGEILTFLLFFVF